MRKLTINTWKTIKIKNLPILNNLHGWAISQKMPVGSFKWIENASPFGKDFIGNCNEDSPVDTGRKLNVLKTFRRRPGPLLNALCTFNLRPVSTESDERYFLDFDVQYPENCMVFTMIYLFSLKLWKLKKLKNFYQTCLIRTNMS